MNFARCRQEGCLDTDLGQFFWFESIYLGICCDWYQEFNVGVGQRLCKVRREGRPTWWNPENARAASFSTRGIRLLLLAKLSVIWNKLWDSQNNNSELFDTHGESQALTPGDVQRLRKEIHSGKQMAEIVALNSSTFASTLSSFVIFWVVKRAL